MGAPEKHSLILWILIGYLSGSIPFGYIIGLLKGVNIRKVGSGNIGATNVTRNLGKFFGALTLLCDVMKGFVPVYFSGKIYHPPEILFVAGSAVLGHCYSIFLLFRGGKGVATSIGVLLALHPLLGFGYVLMWLGGFIVTRISSMSALSAASLMPVFSISIVNENSSILFIIFLTILLFYTHRDNLRRISKGEEGRMKDILGKGKV